jgi:hypothetical protein
MCRFTVKASMTVPISLSKHLKGLCQLIAMGDEDEF